MTENEDLKIKSLCKIQKISQEDMNKEIEEIQEEIKNHRDETAKFQKFDLEALKKKILSQQKELLIN
jgi:antirestriction protein